MIAGGAWFALARKHGSVAADLEAAWQATERHASRIIGAVALVAAIIASVFATRSAAGADASGYLSQAVMWASGIEVYFDRFDPPFQFPEHDEWLKTPLGWRPWDVFAGMGQVPTYPPGLPLLMALPHALAGIDGATAVVTASAALATWTTGVMAGGVAGIVAAVVLAFSPVFLYQSFQPMSDVPVTAAWTLCFLLVRREKSLLAGILCAIAVLIRPNLAPLAAVPFLVSRKKMWFAPPVVVAGLFLGWMQLVWYGSPLRSGYGTAEELFSIFNTGSNAARYFNWLIATAPALLLAPLGFAKVRSNRHARALFVFAFLVIGAYLIYAVFDHWSYLRFLLPALAVFAVFAGIELTTWINRWAPAWRLPIFLVITLGITAHGVFVARSLDVFRLADQLRRVGQVAAFISNQAPDYAVLIAGEQSGSMRYYTERTIFRWEAAEPTTLKRGIDSLHASDRPVYVVLDAFENELFVKKFESVPGLALDWPPIVDAGTTHRTRLWRLADRERFLAGEHINTVRLP